MTMCKYYLIQYIFDYPNEILNERNIINNLEVNWFVYHVLIKNYSEQN